MGPSIRSRVKASTIAASACALSDTSTKQKSTSNSSQRSPRFLANLIGSGCQRDIAQLKPRLTLQPHSIVLVISVCNNQVAIAPKHGSANDRIEDR